MTAHRDETIRPDFRDEIESRVTACRSLAGDSSAPDTQRLLASWYATDIQHLIERIDYLLPLARAACDGQEDFGPCLGCGGELRFCDLIPGNDGYGRCAACHRKYMDDAG